MNVEKFYAECSALLGTIDECQAFPYHKRTRWNNRVPGRGRFEGFGLIRAYGDIVHVNLRHPVAITGVFDGYENALAHIREKLS